MLYIAEIRINSEPESLADQMSQMRAWLNHMQYEPMAFRHVAGKPLCRVDFTDEVQARSFAKAFSGQILSA